MKGCFVTGTDTEIGKTRIAAGLLHRTAQAGWRVAGYKPVASGMEQIDGQWVNDDVQTLWAASSASVSLEQVGPCQFRQACAPHLAARAERRHIDRSALQRGAQALAQHADWIVAEGAGGLCVPLGDDWDSADLMRDLGLPIVLVVGLRLGCINHAILTAEAIAARGLRLAAWVGNTVDPAMLHLADNIATLEHEFQRRFRVPCLGVVPRLPRASAQAVAPHLNGEVLAGLWAMSGLSQPFTRIVS